MTNYFLFMVIFFMLEFINTIPHWHLLNIINIWVFSVNKALEVAGEQNTNWWGEKLPSWVDDRQKDIIWEFISFAHIKPEDKMFHHCVNSLSACFSPSSFSFYDQEDGHTHFDTRWREALSRALYLGWLWRNPLKESYPVIWISTLRIGIIQSPLHTQKLHTHMHTLVNI